MFLDLLAGRGHCTNSEAELLEDLTFHYCRWKTIVLLNWMNSICFQCCLNNH